MPNFGEGPQGPKPSVEVLDDKESIPMPRELNAEEFKRRLNRREDKSVIMNRPAPTDDEIMDLSQADVEAYSAARVSAPRTFP